MTYSIHSGPSAPSLQSIPSIILYQHNFSKPQHPSTPLPNPLLILGSLLPPHLRRLHIRRTLIIRLGQHTHDGNKDLLHALDGRPALRGVLVVVWVVAWWVEDAYADETAGVDYKNSKSRR